MSKPKSGNEDAKRAPGWTKFLIAVLIVAGVGVIWQASNFLQQPYPTYATGVFYSNPTVLGDGASIQLPSNVVHEKKLVFIDLPLQNTVSEFRYQGRVIPLSLYKGGNYLPLIALNTPSGNVITGIRTCEPCGSFSMHIGERQYLICDACGTQWDIETLRGVSGGCQNYPPPKLTASVGDTIEIDLSPLGLQVAS